MDSFLTDDTKAIILLCGVFGKDRTTRPLSPAEYNTLVSWLMREKLRPEALLNMEDLSSIAMGSKIDIHRLEKLLGRGVQLGFAVEEWQSSGLWIISRSDNDYPERYKNHLREKAPPLLFGAGDKSLLQGGGLAIVGSRNVDFNGEEFTREVAEECAQNGMPVVSGAARGVDQIAMRSALEAGGKTIGVMADNLLKASVERHARYAIAEGQLLLISPYHPQARFTVGTAMGRNKLIYAMADYALVVSADHKKGGTWAGAEEELKRGKSIAVFVRMGEQVPAGNVKLLDLGAQKWPESLNHGGLFSLLDDLASQRPEPIAAESGTLSLFDFQPSPAASATQNPKEKPEKQESFNGKSVPDVQKTQSETVYEAALPVLLAHLGNPISVNELAKIVDVAKGQLNTWLNQAVVDGIVKKYKNPVRYSVMGKDGM